VVYGGLRIGLYEPIRNMMVGKDHVGDVGLGIKIAAGLTTGAIGISVASPTDLVKVRREGTAAVCFLPAAAGWQAMGELCTAACPASPKPFTLPCRRAAHMPSLTPLLTPARLPLPQVRMQASGRLPDGHPRKYTSSMAAYRSIISTEGVGALWTGLGPNIARNAIINAAELASYDQIKETLLK
jgi:hypothetical protein